jgi:hypothetical protein
VGWRLVRISAVETNLFKLDKGSQQILLRKQQLVASVPPIPGIVYGRLCFRSLFHNVLPDANHRHWRTGLG